MGYCPECGSPLEDAPAAVAEVQAAKTVSSAEVEIAQINADKEIKLAKLAAGVHEHEADVAADAAVVAAAVEPAVMADPDPTPDVAVEVHAEDIAGGEVHEGTDVSTEEAPAPPEEGENHEDTGRRSGYGSKLWYG